MIQEMIIKEICFFTDRALPRRELAEQCYSEGTAAIGKEIVNLLVG